MKQDVIGRTEGIKRPHDSTTARPIYEHNPRKWHRRIAAARYPALSAGAVVVFLLAWGFLTEDGIVKPSQLPTPQLMGQSLVDFFTLGYQGKPAYIVIGLSVMRVAAGYVIGVVLGIPIGLLMGTSRTVSALVRPFVAFMRPIPMIAFVPVVILFFGIGETSKIILIFASVFFYTVMAAAASAGAVSEQTMLLGKNVGYKGWRLFVHILVPASLPGIMHGLRLAAAVAWLLVVAAEMVSAQAGLGYMILDAATFFRVPYIYIGVILIGLIGLIIDSLLARLQRRVVHWEGK